MEEQEATRPKRGHSHHRALVARDALVLAGSVIAILMGWAAGALPLTGVEPGDVYYDCGPAVFAKPSPLPHPACGSAYNLWGLPLALICYVYLVIGGLGAVVSIGMSLRRLPVR